PGAAPRGDLPHPAHPALAGDRPRAERTVTPRGVGAAWSGPPRRLFSSPLPFPVLGRFGDRRRVPPPTPAPVPVPLRASAPGDSGGTERGLADVVGRGAAPCPRSRTATVCAASAGSALQA